MSKPIIPAATTWPEYFVPYPLPNLDQELGAGRLITLDLPIGEHVLGHLIIVRSLELGGRFLLPITSAANWAFHHERLNPLRTLEERHLAEKDRETFVQDYIERVPSARNNRSATRHWRLENEKNPLSLLLLGSHGNPGAALIDLRHSGPRNQMWRATGLVFLDG